MFDKLQKLLYRAFGFTSVTFLDPQLIVEMRPFLLCFKGIALGHVCLNLLNCSLSYCRWTSTHCTKSEVFRQGCFGKCEQITNMLFPADLFTFTKEIFNGKFYVLKCVLQDYSVFLAPFSDDVNVYIKFISFDTLNGFKSKSDKHLLSLGSFQSAILHAFLPCILFLLTPCLVRAVQLCVE